MHSEITIKVKYLMINTVTGFFKNILWKLKLREMISVLLLTLILSQILIT